MCFLFSTARNSIEIESRPMNFSYSFKPLYRLSWFSGSLPFTIVRDQSGIIIGCCVGIFDVILFVIHIAMHGITVYLLPSIMSSDDFVRATSSFSVIAGHLFSLIQNVASAISIVMCLLNRNRFVDIFKAFDTFDREVHMYIFSNFKSK